MKDYYVCTCSKMLNKKIKISNIYAIIYYDCNWFGLTETGYSICYEEHFCKELESYLISLLDSDVTYLRQH